MNNNTKYIIKYVAKNEIPLYYLLLSSTKVVQISTDYLVDNNIDISKSIESINNSKDNYVLLSAKYRNFIIEKNDTEIKVFTDLYWFIHEYNDELCNIHDEYNNSDFYKLSLKLSIEPSRLLFWCNFVYNRQYIWYQRYVNKLPQEKWYIDETLKYTKILNIFRCHDKVSSYIINKICKSTTDIKNKIFNLIAARYINTFNFYEIFDGELFDINKMSNEDYQEWIYNCIAKYRIETGKYIFNNCYCVCRGKRPNQGNRIFTKAWTLVDSLVLASKLVSNIELDKFYNDYKYAESIYYQCRYVGPFLVGEMMQDAAYLSETNWTADDFLYIGPGALYQSSLMYLKNPEDSILDKADYIIRTIWENQYSIFNEFKKLTGKDFYLIVNEDCIPTPPKICLSDVESSFCELRKYTKVFSNIPAESLNKKNYEINTEKERL